MDRVITNLKLKLLQDDKAAWEIALKCGFSPSLLSHYATGRRTMRPKHLRALARYFKCSQQEILGTSIFEMGDLYDAQ